MNKSQAITQFWESFGWTAYDENSVPDDAITPYITYEVQTDSLDSNLMLSASLWDTSFSWRDISLKAEQIEKALKEHGYISKRIDNGYVWFKAGTPFATRMNTQNDTIKRIVLNIEAEFLTAY